MITYFNGNIFSKKVQVYVNPVNTVGVMGKGLALTYKKMYPNMFKRYKQICDEKKFDIGMLQLYKTQTIWILNFPTKRDWKEPSRLEYIEAGLQKFVSTYKQKGILSIVFPKLGCGEGGLDFETQVKPLMEQYLQPLVELNIYICLGY